MKIKLSHNDQIIEANDSESLLAQLKKNNFAIKSICGGCASCGACIVQIIDGEENLQEPTFEEKQLIGNVFHITKERLACQTYLHGDVTVDITKHLEIGTKKAITVRRTKAESEQIKETRMEERKERNANKPKKLGGGKKPKAFNFKDEEEK
jgi:2Fe-2S ferredoxin